MSSWGPTTVGLLSAAFNVSVDWSLLGNFEGTEGEVAGKDGGEILVGNVAGAGIGGLNLVVALRGRVLNGLATDTWSGITSGKGIFNQSLIFNRLHGMLFVNRSAEQSDQPLVEMKLLAKGITWGYVASRDSVRVASPGMFLWLDAIGSLVTIFGHQFNIQNKTAKTGLYDLLLIGKST